MKKLSLALYFITCLTLTGSGSPDAPQAQTGKPGFFDIKSDLLIANYDSKPDPDDILSVAALATILRDSRFSEVSYIAVAGAYGIQGGQFIEADSLFNMSFGSNWTDAHSDRQKARETVVQLALQTLKNGGDIWIAEAGQSDFSADVLKVIRERQPGLDTKQRVHLVQHSTWNESQTSEEKLLYVRNYADYIKIPDGNSEGNGTPGFNTENGRWWDTVLDDPEVGEIWKEARRIVLEKNGKTGYKNPAIAAGGFDFSDTAEAAWIFGFGHLENTNAFFAEFL